MKILPVKAELFHADGWGGRQTDNDKVSRSSQFCERIKKTSKHEHFSNTYLHTIL
jgi:hypothetical protein